MHLRFHTPRGNGNGADSPRQPAQPGSPASELQSPEGRGQTNAIPEDLTRRAGQGEEALQPPVELWWGIAQVVR